MNCTRLETSHIHKKQKKQNKLCYETVWFVYVLNLYNYKQIRNAFFCLIRKQSAHDWAVEVLSNGGKKV